MLSIIFFFFQAEDGIRDLTVTGVQTCALPICSDLHLRVGEPPLFRTHGEIKRQRGSVLSVNDLELLILSIMPERNRGEWKETGDTDFAYEITGVARYRVNAARDRRGPVAVFRVIPAQVVTVKAMGLTDEFHKLGYLTK